MATESSLTSTLHVELLELANPKHHLYITLFECIFRSNFGKLSLNHVLLLLSQHLVILGFKVDKQLHRILGSLTKFENLASNSVVVSNFQTARSHCFCVEFKRKILHVNFT